MNKVCASADAAIAAVRPGMTLAVGGFGLCGIPEMCIAALHRAGTGELHIVSNNCGVDDFGLGLLLQQRQIARMVSSYVGENHEFARQYLAGELQVELVPQGTLAERLRAGGAGIPAFYTPAGVDTPASEGKELREFDGKRYVLETAIVADVALIKAEVGDRLGNLRYRGTARNFNPLCAMAAKVTIAEVERLVEPGSLDPDDIHTPGIFVQHVLQGTHEKRIERRQVRPAEAASC